MEGFVKLIADPQGERLLGVQVVGEGATELESTKFVAARGFLCKFAKTFRTINGLDRQSGMGNRRVYLVDDNARQDR